MTEDEVKATLASFATFRETIDPEMPLRLFAWSGRYLDASLHKRNPRGTVLARTWLEAGTKVAAECIASPYGFQFTDALLISGDRVARAFDGKGPAFVLQSPDLILKDREDASQGDAGAKAVV